MHRYSQKHGGHSSENTRSPDPLGHRHRYDSGHGESQVLAAKKLLHVMNRSPGQAIHDPLNRVPNQQSPALRDQIYNSFTASYHIQGSSEKKDPPPALDEHYRQKFREAEKETPRTRRVNFSEQLEIGKTTQRPSTLTTPILRTRERKKKSTPLQAKTRITVVDTRNPTVVETMPKSASNPRDPTPRSSEKPPRATQGQQPNGRQPPSVNDPPMNPSKALLFSPANNPRMDIFSRLEQMEKANKTPERKEDFSLADKGKSIGPSAYATPRSFQHATSPDSWDVQRLFSNGNGNSNPNPRTRKDGNLFPRRSESDLESRDSTISSHIFAGLLEQPLRAYTPQTDHWDAPDLYPELWRYEPGSPSEASSESQSEYLINKYTKKDLSKKRIYSLSVGRNQAGDGVTTDRIHNTPLGSSIHVETFSSEPRVNNISGGIRGKRQNKQKGYSQLEDDMEGEQEYGTELILVPRVQDHIDVHNKTDISGGSGTPTKRRGLGKCLRGQPVSSSSKVPFQELPVVAVSYDDSADLKQSTGDTDSDSELGFNTKASKWDNFDQDSKTGEHDNLYLISPRGSRSRKKLILASMLLCLVVFCLSVGLPIYFTMGKGKELNNFELVENSQCVNRGTEDAVFSERYTTILKYLTITKVGNPDQLDSPGSPQRKSLCWLSDFDERQLSLTNDNIQALVQRYTLGVIYYSLVTEESDNSGNLKKTDFLSSSNECDWDVIMCNIPNKVTALLLADKSLSGSIPAEVGNLGHLCE